MNFMMPRYFHVQTIKEILLKIKNMKFFIVAVLCSLGIVSFSQDNETVARMYNTKAEEYYNTSDWAASFNELNEAEAALSTTNPKILYLKIKALSLSGYKNNFCYLFELDTTLKKFFSLTNAKTYPADKYMEIASISAEFKQLKNALGSVYDSVATTGFRKTRIADILKGLEAMKIYDIKNAVKHFQTATEKGSHDAHALLGICYLLQQSSVSGSYQISGTPAFNKNNTELQLLYSVSKIGASESAETIDEFYNDILEKRDDYIAEQGAETLTGSAGNNKADMFRTMTSNPVKGTNEPLDHFLIAHRSGSLLAPDKILARLLKESARTYAFASPPQSFAYYLQCAELGDTECMQAVSAMYRKGEGVKKDKAKAEEWEKKSGTLKR